MLNTAEILRDEDFYLLHHIAQRFYMAVCQNDAVNVKALANCPVAVQRRVLRFWLGGEGEDGPTFGFEQIEAVGSWRRAIRREANSMCLRASLCTGNTTN